MTEMTITCAYCGGHDFLLRLTLAGTTMLCCVNHEDHVKNADLASQRAVHKVMRDVEHGHEQ